MNWRIGVTGGIGSGKSTVTSLLEQHAQAFVLDFDAISRELTAPGGGAIPMIAAEFGNAVMTAEGTLDRAAMRHLVFQNASAKTRLEHIVHPLIAQEVQRRIQTAKLPAAQWMVFDIPLLSAALQRTYRLQHILVVDCDRATQIQRVAARNHWSPSLIEAVIDQQPSRQERLRLADHVIWNGADVTLQSLADAVHRWIHRCQSHQVESHSHETTRQSTETGAMNHHGTANAISW